MRVKPPARRPTPNLPAGPGPATALTRYANPALAHKTTQIAMDGSQKLPPRLLGTAGANPAAGRTPHHALLGVAGWTSVADRALRRLSSIWFLNMSVRHILNMSVRHIGEREVSRVLELTRRGRS